MELRVTHAAFHRKRLSVRTASFFSSAAVLLDGIPVKRAKGKYALTDDSGQAVVAELKSSLVDPVPSLRIGDQTIALAPKLKWHEYAWTGLPILLLFTGGALGAIVGMSAAFANTRIFRGARTPAAKYMFTGLVTVLAAVVFLVLATFLHLLINGSPK